MIIIKVLDVRSNTVTKIELCHDCQGTGSQWSTLEFGDIPGDEEQFNCDTCDGTGRIKIIEVVAAVVVPSNYTGINDA